MLSFEQLIEEHEAISVAARALERILAASRPNVISALAARARMCALLTEHLAHEDAQVYPRLMAVSHESTADIARRFAVQYQSMVADWAYYNELWTGEAIGADWRGFRRATAAMIAVLRKRMEAENAILYPTALAATALTLRRQAA